MQKRVARTTQRLGPTPFQYRLRDYLIREESVLGSYLRLEQEIVKASGNDTRYRVDRRKLSDIVLGADVKLDFAELQALEVFFTSRGLPNLFAYSSVLDSLAERNNITFLIGAKPREETTDMSRWDVRSLATLQRGIYSHHNPRKFNITDVLLRHQHDDSSSSDQYDEYENPLSMIQEDDWYREMTRPDNHVSYVSIGSPRACLASEVMMSMMLRTEPFKPRRLGETDDVPVRFIWSDLVGLESTFAIIDTTTPTALRTLQPRTLGVIIEGRPVYSSGAGGVWNGYGLIAAQRRKSGEIWLVVAGLTGATTEATARFLEECECDVPQAVDGEHSEVLLMVVEATIKSTNAPPSSLHPNQGSFSHGLDRGDNRRRAQRGEDRIIESYRIYWGPHRYNGTQKVTG